VVLGVRVGSVKIKKYLHSDVVIVHLLYKGFIDDYLCWYAHRELFVHNESMIERVVGSTSSANNEHGVVNDNSNPYRHMVIDAMRMNQGNVSQCPIVEEEPNADATRFSLLVELKRMLHPHVSLVKNCMTFYQSTVTLCLVSNQVSRSFLVLV
jgi:hypothetical protein